MSIKDGSSSVGISNMHSKAAGTVQLNECCGQNMKGLNAATFSSDIPQQNQNPFKWCQNVRSNFFGENYIFHIKPSGFQQCCCHIDITHLGGQKSFLLDRIPPFHIFVKTSCKNFYDFMVYFVLLTLQCLFLSQNCCNGIL